MSTNSRLRVEALEARDCPAFAVTPNLYNGVLVVEGTDGDDTITVTQSGSTISVAGRSFNSGSINLIVITGQNGNDTLRDLTAKGSVIYGGLGNDTLSGGGGNDVLYGGWGDDNLNGNGGLDVLWGGQGNDTLTDPTGQDQLNQGSSVQTRGNTSMEAEIIRLVNIERSKAGLRALTTNSQLNAAAALHSQDMVTISNRFGPNAGMQHNLSGVSRPTPTDRLDAVGYDDWSQSYGWGENIAWGFTSAQAVVNAWMNSPSHRANVLHADYTEIGVGVATDAAGRIFYTQNFGYRN